MAGRLVVTAFGWLPGTAQDWVLAQTAPRHALGVLVLLRRPDGAVLVVRQSYRPGWSLPGGTQKRGETLEQTGLRELREEVGLELDRLDVDPAAEPDRRRRAVTWYAQAHLDARQAAAVASCSAELVELRWVSPDELLELAPEIADALAGFRAARP